MDDEVRYSLRSAVGLSIIMIVAVMPVMPMMPMTAAVVIEETGL
jgi:hypothetical protein